MFRESSPIPNSEIFGSEKVKARVPFPIRAHHLDKYANASPDGKLNKTVLVGNTFLTLTVKDSVETTVDYIQNEADEEYRIDVFGADEKPDVFRTRMRAAMTLFYSLPEDYPVIVSAGKDVICDSCVVGNHCDRYTPEGIGQEVASITLLMDSIALARALETGNNTFALQILMQRQQGQYRPKMVPALQTDAGTLRKAFKAMEQLRQIDAERLRSKLSH
jgi:hypothetical protein